MSILLFVITLVALGMTAFCAGAETGFLSVRHGRVIHMAREGGARAKIINEALSHLGRTTTALLVGNNLAAVCYSSSTAALGAILCQSSPLLHVLFSFLSALVILFFGEFLPKLLCAARPLRRLLLLAPVWRVFARFFEPVGAVFQLVIERVLPKREVKPKMTPESALKILQDRKDGVRLSAFERVLVGRILSMRAKGEFIVPDALLSALDEIV